MKLYTKTIKTAAIREPRNYWIDRRVWADGVGNEYVKINGYYVSIDSLIVRGWDVHIYF